MRSLQILTAAEQVAVHLRSELLQKHWTGEMPGSDRLALELGVYRYELLCRRKLL